MDNKTVAITVTASAVGVGLAYLGYNKYYDVNNDIKEIREEIEGELNEKISRKEWLELNGARAKIEPTAWSTFWSNEYKQANNEGSENDEVHFFCFSWQGRSPVNFFFDPNECLKSNLRI